MSDMQINGFLRATTDLAIQVGTDDMGIHWFPKKLIDWGGAEPENPRVGDRVQFWIPEWFANEKLT